MTMLSALTGIYLQKLLSTSRGQAFLLNQVAAAEDSDEADIFESVLAHVDDPKLQQLIRKHHDDEKMHAAMFTECLARTGHARTEVPRELRIIDRIEEGMGGFRGKRIHDDEGVMRVYLVLQVVEERALTQFAVYEKAFRGVDEKTADVFAGVARDEQRHLKYCHAIARKYAPDVETHEATLRQVREIELRAFQETSQLNMRHAMDNGIVRMGPVEGAFWKGLGTLGTKLGKGPRTPFFDEPADSRMTSLPIAA